MKQVFITRKPLRIREHGTPSGVDRVSIAYLKSIEGMPGVDVIACSQHYSQPIENINWSQYSAGFIDTGYLFQYCNDKTGILIHDTFMFTHVPEFWRQIEKCPFILTLSEYVKREILSETNIEPHRIIVVGAGYNRDLFYIPTSRALRDHKTVLYVGATYQRKNIEGLKYTMEEVWKRYPNTILSMVGNKLDQCIADPWFKYRTPSKVRFNTHVDDGELAAHYQNCDCFIYPSLEEGFGLPLLEAQACGARCVAFRFGAMKEVAGPSVLLAVTPDEFTELVLNTLKLPPIYGKEVYDVDEHVKTFSWSYGISTVVEWFHQTLEFEV